MLHTYGELSDAQLLLTYGFVEEPQPAAAGGSTAADAQEEEEGPREYVDGWGFGIKVGGWVGRVAV